MSKEAKRSDLRIPDEYNLIRLKALMREAMADAYQRGDSEYLEHLSLLMLAAVKAATGMRDVVVDGGHAAKLDALHGVPD